MAKMFKQLWNENNGTAFAEMSLKLKYRADDHKNEIQKFQEIPFRATTHIVVLLNSCNAAIGKVNFACNMPRRHRGAGLVVGVQRPVLATLPPGKRSGTRRTGC
jgi:hypothetical protein